MNIPSGEKIDILLFEESAAYIPSFDPISNPCHPSNDPPIFFADS
jgi:hypothetical protein